MIKIIRSEQDHTKMNVEFYSQHNFFSIKNIVQSFACYNFNKTTKSYNMVIDDADALIDKLAKSFTDEIIQVDMNVYDSFKLYQEKKQQLFDLREKLDSVDCGIELQKPYKLLPFQHIGAEFLYQVQYGILADKVGLGKTIQSLAAAIKMHNEGKSEKCFVIVPSSLKSKWHDDILKFFGIESYLLEGHISKRIEMYNEWMKDDTYFLIVSDDMFKRDWDNYMSGNVLRKFGMICDEIQRVKSFSTMRSHKTRELAAHKFCTFRFGLSATYIETGLENLFGEMLIIDDRIFGNSYMRFANKYLKLDIYGRVLKYENVDDITNKMKTVAIRRHKEQVQSQLEAFLPKVNENTLWVELTKEQKKSYNEILERVIDNIHNMEKANKVSMATALSELMFLRQVSIATGLMGYNPSSSVKMDTLKEIIPDIVAENKVLIFCHFVGFIDIMEEEFNKMGIKCLAVSGNRKDCAKSSDVKHIIDRFTNESDIRILLGSDKLKEGHDIVAASYIINTDILWNPASMIQRAGRIDRLNQTAKRIFVINIWSNSGIEAEMYKILYKREQLAEKVMDDGNIEKRINRVSFTDIKKMLKYV